jgi:hypothetical protein
LVYFPLFGILYEEKSGNLARSKCVFSQIWAEWLEATNQLWMSRLSDDFIPGLKRNISPQNFGNVVLLHNHFPLFTCVEAFTYLFYCPFCCVKYL